MSKFNPKKLSVELRNGVTTTEPVKPRRYTLTHSDITGELFLTIGLNYAYDKITYMRDEVFGEWVKKNGRYLFYVFLHVDKKFNPIITAIRNHVFRRELPLALKSIAYGDKKFLDAHPKLYKSPIMVYFMSYNPAFNKIEDWGTFSDYKL